MTAVARAHAETIALHAGWRAHANGAFAVPIYQTTSDQFHDTYRAANLFALKELGHIYAQMFRHVGDIGDDRSLAIHPATTTHSQLAEVAQLASGVTPGDVRLSIGLEHIDDIIADLEKGLNAARG